MNIAIASHDFGYRERLAAALRLRGMQVYSVPDIAGILTAASQARLSLAVVEPALLASEAVDLRAQIRSAYGYDAAIVAMANEADAAMHHALERHGATLAKRAPKDIVGFAEWLVSVPPPSGEGLPAGGHWGNVASTNEGAVLGADGTGPSILVVDDEPSFRRFLCAALGDRGYRVWASENGAEAMRFLQHTPVDLVLSDINMPVMNGFELKQEIDRRKDLRIPFVMMTADGRRDNAEDAAALGVVFVLAKPIRNIDSLYAIVSEALASRDGD